ncbi:hypothetical protein Ciccas_001232 [Cichlidogyrus casuarinus]|uniref:G-protein coupled receptors family 2 profile 2 domain-containing protein n=1 Tax=Cichlidogyrus casuarinus TaxID=1844966 RepID=A0ABD2QKM5_9PLAT
MFICFGLEAMFQLINAFEFDNIVMCILKETLWDVFRVARFFWMFAQGLYLVLILKQAFQYSRKIYLISTSIAWGEKSVRAVLILVPLLGLQNFLVFHQWSEEEPYVYVGDFICMVVIPLQVKLIRY